MFYADLVKEIVHPHRNDFVRLKSYSGLNSTGELRVEGELRGEDFTGKSLLIVEDMHDTGHTLKKFIKLLEGLNPKRIDTAVLIRRPDRPVEIDLKFCGLVCDDFIVGYGLDFD
jgi:hypoxanthine phosphoribosyltransferase